MSARSSWIVRISIRGLRVLRRSTVLVLVLLASLMHSDLAHTTTLQDYLPRDLPYDPAIPTPRSVLGYEVGEWHVRHDQLVQYMRVLAEASDRILIEETGRTYEERPLLLLTISSPRNLANIEQIRQEHQAALQPGSSPASAAERPVVVYLAYSVHGNESSGSNASMVIAYHLASAQGAAIDSLLDNVVVLLDPSLNPDGLNRFSHWANMHRGKNLVADANHREHLEAWPGGRTNHYWFDLNRDWLLLQHPESRARIRQFHRWKPNILTDFHEMGSDATYFFQPGVPSRRHPWTPAANVELTQAIANFHAQAFDAQGVLYFSQEIFDDFYYGKGSTYPDINGAIGILFEQASARGHLQESSYGTFDFASTIRNQCLTSLSTLQAAQAKREDLLRYQREFYESARSEAAKAGTRAIVFGEATNRSRTSHLLEILLQHGIRVHELATPLRTDSGVFEPGSAYVVPTEQSQYRLVRALFEERTTFEDSIFYDVSTWTLPLAMGVAAAELQQLPRERLGAEIESLQLPTATQESATQAYAYAFSWHEYYAPRALYRLLKADVRARVATRPFTAQTSSGSIEFGYGSVVVPVGIQPAKAAIIQNIAGTIATEDAVDVHVLETGLTPDGVDLGSPSLEALKLPKPLLLVGDGVSSTEAGELWHLLDQRMDIEVALVEISHLNRIRFDKYTHLIMVNGSYDSIAENHAKKIEDWIRTGGVLIATKAAVRWARDHEFIKVSFVDDEKKESEGKASEDKSTEKESHERLDYVDRGQIRGADFISSAILSADLDITHPLGYGYLKRDLVVFRNSTLFMQPSKDPYATVLQYTKQPLLSGYVSSKNLEKLSGTASLIAERLGNGVVILMLDNPNFRGYWYGTNKLFLNALFFGSVIDRTGS